MSTFHHHHDHHGHQFLNMSLFNLSLPDEPLKAYFKKHTLNFKQLAGTSRGVMSQKECFIIYVEQVNHPGIFGVGECSPLWGLSIDSKEDYEDTLQQLCEDINHYQFWLQNDLKDYPSICFGLEMALKDLEQGGNRILFPSKFTEGQDSIEINGLVWMGEIGFMEQQIKDKLDDGYDCIKLKIGSLDFEQEMNLLRKIRAKYKSDQLTIRVDANGAFSPEDVMQKLTQLSHFEIHSIEQPIKAGQWEKMKEICTKSPIPIALDEELIGITNQKQKLIQTINPHYLILKPSLLGGFKSTEQWIHAARTCDVKWWITSALESNIGLNAIAQFTYITGNKMPQGLGTGSLYSNNVGKVNFLSSKHFHYQDFQIPL